jgi:glycosyltransferase involved in cell wall biosynthesis
MKIAVVIPSFNQGKYISKALENKFPQVRLLINNTNRGPSYSRNCGIESSTSDLITFLDSDDLWPDDKIQWQYDYLIQNPNIDMVAGYGDYFFSEKICQNDLRRHYLEGKPHFNAYLGTFLIRRSVFDRIGMFDVEMRLSEDQDWFMRTREAGVSLKVKEKISLRKRVHDANTTDGLSFKNSGFIQALRNSIRRREEINNNLKSNL